MAQYLSFVIRLWLSKGEVGTPERGLHGRIEHVQSGSSAPVRSLDDVLAFVRTRLQDARQHQKRTGASSSSAIEDGDAK